MNQILGILTLAACLFGMTACAPISHNQESEVLATTHTRKNHDPENAEILGPKSNAQIELDDPLPLSQAIALVLKHSPKLKAYAWDIRSADARQAQARLRPNPELEVSMEEFGGQGPRNGFDGVETTFAVTQAIETGGKRHKRSQVASMEKNLAQWDYQMTRLGVIKQTQQAFAEVLAVQRQIALTKDQMRLAEQLLGTVNRRVEAGKDSPSEMAKAQIEFDHTQMDYKQAISDLASAKRHLVVLWGAATLDVELIDEPGDIDVDLPPLAQLQPLAHQHPQVLLWQDKLALGRARLSLMKAQSRSNMAVTAGLKRLGQEDENTGVVGLAIPLPLFNRNQGEIEAAHHELAKIRELQIQAVAQVESQLAQSYQRFETALAHVSMLQDSILVNARTVFEAASKGYEEGKFDYLHVLDAQRTLFNTQAQLLKAQTSVRLAWADLEYMVGQSTE